MDSQRDPSNADRTRISPKSIAGALKVPDALRLLDGSPVRRGRRAEPRTATRVIEPSAHAERDRTPAGGRRAASSRGRRRPASLVGDTDEETSPRRAAAAFRYTADFILWLTPSSCVIRSADGLYHQSYMQACVGQYQRNTLKKTSEKPQEQANLSP